MREAIEAGSILIERTAPLPDSWLPQGGTTGSDDWTSVNKPDRPALEASIRQAGWTFFYMAGEIQASVFGFDEHATLRRAVKRLTSSVKTQRLNCLEITRVATKSFLGVAHTTVAGHARHIQEGLVLHRTLKRPDGAASQPPARSSPGHRGDVTREPLLAADAVAAWEDEGGASGQVGGRSAARTASEIRAEDMGSKKEVLV